MIESLIGMIRYLSPRQDDDAVDRLHYLYTPNILLAFAVLISFKQFGGRPLECMFPNKFPGSWEQVRFQSHLSFAFNFLFHCNNYFKDEK
ncbi:unnamed protein product [Toxocara canis]|uniref:Innexin n=1 Tax=Toxocara canis TaxID=6265 RepID=A0A183VBM3_TOXCA|nr:unnamed protein product [Toxocara canis]